MEEMLMEDINGRELDVGTFYKKAVGVGVEVGCVGERDEYKQTSGCLILDCKIISWWAIRIYTPG
jgi:hypothetical protein